MSLYPCTLRVMVLIVALVGNACSGVPDDSPLATLSPTAPPARPTPTVLPPDLAAEPTSAPTPSPTPSPAPSDPLEEGLGHAPVGQTEIALVLSITDGDTIRVDRGRGSEPLRYIGIDSPESVHPDRPVEEMAREATEFNRSLVEVARSCSNATRARRTASTGSCATCGCTKATSGSS